MPQASTELNVILQQFAARYRGALLTKAGVLAGLGVGVLGVLGWRLHRLSLHPHWAVGVSAAIAVLLAGSLAWWLRRCWITAQGAAAHLDRTLGLQQRLVTAEEFAGASPAPALYPLLVEDVEHHYTGSRTRFPRPFDRAAGILAGLLIMLLFWPTAGGGPLHLAQLPGVARPPQPSPQEMPPQPQQDRQRQGQEGSGQQHSLSGQGSSGASSGSQSSQPQAQGQGNQQEASSGDRGRGQEGRGAAGSQARHSDGAAQDGNRAEGQEAGSRKQETTGTGQQAGDGQQGSADRAQSGNKQQATGDKGQATGDKGQGQANHTPQQAGENRETGQQGEQQSAALQQQTGHGNQQSLGNQETVKAEIQELLKEVSGELKQLQQQMDASKNQQQPNMGTSTDPNLYEPPMTLDGKAGSSLPIQLQTDTAQMNTQRRGSGTGRPSEMAARATPQTQAEEAQLANEPLEETPAERHPIPPEYRGAFERLHQQNPQPSETKQ